jgi:hypothetical protein
MLLATATAPGAPILIMPGVSTKAPPVPMKPLRVPPRKPSKMRKIILHRSRVIKEPAALLITSIGAAAIFYTSA